MANAHRPKLLKAPNDNEHGATALFIASTLILLFGMAAVAVDVGAGFNERRQNQTAADVSALAGAIDFRFRSDAMRDLVLDFAELNLNSNYTPDEWRISWESCVDPDRTGGGFNFVPVESKWTPGTDIDCISVDATGFLRVKIPNQFTPTSFARILGVNALQTNAAAIARLKAQGIGGILPFTVVGTDSAHFCMKSTQGGGGGGQGGGGGGIPDPCEGQETGSFGAVGSPLYGNPADDMQTYPRCGNPQSNYRYLSTNTALGIDHPIVPKTNGAGPSGRVLDVCGNVAPNSMMTDQGNPMPGLQAGLINGGSNDFWSPIAVPRLQRTPFDTRQIAGEDIDNFPLWEFLLLHNTLLIQDADPHTPGDQELRLLYGTNAPSICDPNTFDDGTMSDWDGDDVDESDASWQHLEACLDAYMENEINYVQMFKSEIALSPRFAYVPEFWQLDLTQSPIDIKGFRAIWIQGLWFGQGQTTVFHPGEPGGNVPANLNLFQASGFIIPNNALPLPLRSNSPSFGGAGVFFPELYR